MGLDNFSELDQDNDKEPEILGGSLVLYIAIISVVLAIVVWVL